ncbi:MAG: hypothetical protein ACLVB5_04880 [Christensenellales bacterium]
MLVEHGAHRCTAPHPSCWAISHLCCKSGDRDLGCYRAMHIDELKLVGRAARIEIARNVEMYSYRREFQEGKTRGSLFVFFCISRSF